MPPDVPVLFHGIPVPLGHTWFGLWDTECGIYTHVRDQLMKDQRVKVFGLPASFPGMAENLDPD